MFVFLLCHNQYIYLEQVPGKEMLDKRREKRKLEKRRENEKKKYVHLKHLDHTIRTGSDRLYMDSNHV